MNKRNIFLTGFMGAGKSTIGRRLARRLGYRFADLDELIAAREGRSIAEIFAAQGEAYFRDCEAAVLAEQTTADQVVFATGGGIVGRAENRAMMRQLGSVVYLRAAWSTLEQRLAKGRGGGRSPIRKRAGTVSGSCGRAACYGTKKPMW